MVAKSEKETVGAVSAAALCTSLTARADLVEIIDHMS
jgi:hypothetical protein